MPVELTDESIEMIHRDGIGIYQIKDIKIAYRRFDLYCIGYMIGYVFYGDKDEFCDKRNLKNRSMILGTFPEMREAKSVGSFKYDRLPMDKVKTRWDDVIKLLKSKKPADVQLGIASVCVLTSESWRFFAIRNACTESDYSLCLQNSVWTHVDGLPKAVTSIVYTLRELLNDWSKLSSGEAIVVKGQTIPFTENDIKKILRMEVMKPKSKYRFDEITNRRYRKDKVLQ